MKKILTMLFVLVFSSTHASESKTNVLVDGWIFYFPENYSELVAVEPSNPIFNNLNSLHPPEVELLLAYMLPSDLERINSGLEPTMSEFVQVTTIPGKDYGREDFMEQVNNDKQELIDNEKTFNSVREALEEQSEKLSSQSGVNIDNSISALIPFPPFIDEKDTFGYTYLAMKEQRVNGEYSKTARLTSTLLKYLMEGRIVNIAFYSNYEDNNSLGLQASAIKKWNSDFDDLILIIENELSSILSAEDAENYQEALVMLQKWASLGDTWAKDEVLRLENLVKSKKTKEKEEKSLLERIAESQQSEKNETENEPNQFKSLFEFEVPKKIDNSIVETLFNQPVNQFDFGVLKLEMEIDEYLEELNWNFRPKDIGLHVNDSAGINFQIFLRPLRYMRQFDLFKNKSTDYICDVMRQSFVNDVLAFRGDSSDDGKFITHRNFGSIFNGYGSQKQRAKIGELLLTNSVTKIYEDISNQTICEINTLGDYHYPVDMMTLIDLKK